MRIYIMTDMEGISGAVDIAYMDRSTHFFQSARELLTGDVNAAVAGCFDAGATEVVVKDGHHRGNNFITQMLDERITLDGRLNPWTGILDGSFDTTMLVGAHAMAGTLNGFLDHTMSPESWFEYSINRRPLGEIGMWATIAGHYKVPLVYVSGDRAACREAEALLPGIVTTAVKTGCGRNKAMATHPEEAQRAIRRDVARTLSAGKWPRPLTWKKPITVQLIFYRSDMADGERPGVTRVDARTLRKKTADQRDILL